MFYVISGIIDIIYRWYEIETPGN